MHAPKTFIHSYPILIVCLVIAACASRPELTPRTSAVPIGADLSGLWQLREDPGARPMPNRDADPQVRLPPKNTARPARPSRRESGSAVSMFLETGETLKISQTPAGLFISFDRAIVEEYTFGENRVVSVGPIEAQRVSGWTEQAFVVETLDTQGVLLTESWHLEEDGAVLVRDISIRRGEDEQFASRQHFDRI